jgi:hypothetical protein
MPPPCSFSRRDFRLELDTVRIAAHTGDDAACRLEVASRVGRAHLRSAPKIMWYIAGGKPSV